MSQRVESATSIPAGIFCWSLEMLSPVALSPLARDESILSADLTIDLRQAICSLVKLSSEPSCSNNLMLDFFTASSSTSPFSIFSVQSDGGKTRSNGANNFRKLRSLTRPSELTKGLSHWLNRHNWNCWLLPLHLSLWSMTNFTHRPWPHQRTKIGHFAYYMMTCCTGEASLGLDGRIWLDGFWKKCSLGDRTKFQSTTSAATRGGEAWRRNVWSPVYARESFGTAPLCRLGWVWAEMIV